MIEKILLRAMIPFLLLAGVTGCKSTDPASDGSTQKKMCAEVLNAIGEKNYPAFQVICGELIPEKSFISAHQNMRRQFGELEDFRFITSLRTPVVQNDIWLVTFRRKDADGNNDILQDLLFRFVTGEDADGWKVIGFAFL